MADPTEASIRDTNRLSGWTLVDSQGELMQQVDGDSDSSESSIEVVSVQGSDIVSFHHGRHEAAESPSESSATEERDKNEITGASGTDTNRESLEDEKPAVKDPLQPCSSSTAAEILEGNSSSGELAAAQDNDDDESDDDAFGKREPLDASGADQSEPLSPLPCQEEHPASEMPDLDQTAPEQGEGAEAVGPGGGDLSTELTSEYPDGACCVELLSESESKKIEASGEECAGDSSCRDTETGEGEQADLLEMAKPTGDEVMTQSQVSSKSGSFRGDSDTDSDFVRLDPDNLDDYENHVALEGASAPLRRSGSSIDENFSFLRGQDAREPHPQPPPPLINRADDVVHEAVNPVEDENDDIDGDIDGDDETESSTEEGFDDRIESEQSDAGSLSNLNDVGDLSAFADIGDIPIVAGDVRRNYIHRPNNHLSTVLNLSLVLASILTMGISLGIIMATEIELEEWQNVQTIRVKQLEAQLRERRTMLEAQDAKVSHLEALTWQLRSRLADTRTQSLRLKKTERALDWLETNGIVEGGHFSHAAHLVRGVIHVFVHCVEEDDDFSSGFSEGDNGSTVVPSGPCANQLEVYMGKLKALADAKQRGLSPLRRQDAFDLDEEAEVDGLDAELGGPLDDDPNTHINDGVRSDGGDVEKAQQDAPKDEIFRDDEETEEDSSPEENANVRSEKREGKSSHNLDAGSNSKEKQEQGGRVALDIRQLQQSLSREQERALHWQQLYLSERRQRERERESEEWEDERDREQWERVWEREKEREEEEKSERAHQEPDLDEIACLKKVLASNLTTLTQHVARWNVSVFDDFANLSILLSSVEDLKHSVMDTVGKVWDGAEEVLERMRGGGSSGGDEDASGDAHTNSQWGDGSVPKQEMIAKYLLEVMRSIREKSGPQLEALLANLQDRLMEIRKVLEAIGQEVNSDSMAYWLQHAWSVSGSVMDKVRRDVSEVIPDKEILMAHLANLLKSLDVDVQEEEEEDVMMAEHGVDGDEKDGDTLWREEQEHESYRAHDDDDSMDTGHLNSSIDEDDGDNDDDEDDDDDDDEEEDAHKNRDNQGSWSKGLSSILSKTQKSFKQLGRKVSRTFGEIQTIWSKKDQPLIRMAKRLTSKFVRASMKLTKLPATLFNQGSSADSEKGDHQVQVHSKAVKKLRKQWQEHLLENPCRAAGKLSPECGQDRKALKRDLKEVSELFSQLLKIKTFSLEEAMRLSREDAALHCQLFKSFLERWGGRGLLLKKDLEWAVCHRNWWWRVAQGLQQDRSGGPGVELESCNTLSTHASPFPGGDIEELKRLKASKKNKKEKKDRKEKDDDDDDDDNSDKFDEKNNNHIGPQRSQEFSNSVRAHEHKRNSSEPLQATKEEAGPDADWYAERARYRLQNRRDKEKKLNGSGKRKHFQDSKNKNKKWSKGKSQGRSDDWFLKKAHDRQIQRNEHEKSEWVFERARHRRDSIDNHQHRTRRGKYGKRHPSDENWTLKHGHYRQQQRDEEHRADWVFSRAADRKEHHHTDLLGCRHGKRFGKDKHNKDFRCAYGGVSSP